MSVYKKIQKDLRKSSNPDCTVHSAPTDTIHQI